MAERWEHKIDSPRAYLFVRCINASVCVLLVGKRGNCVRNLNKSNVIFLETTPKAGALNQCWKNTGFILKAGLWRLLKFHREPSNWQKLHKVAAKKIVEPRAAKRVELPEI